jgi:hypothetical protein
MKHLLIALTREAIIFFIPGQQVIHSYVIVFGPYIEDPESITWLQELA